MVCYGTVSSQSSVEFMSVVLLLASKCMETRTRRRGNHTLQELLLVHTGLAP